MKLEFDVNINTKALYDYMLHHTYSSFSGILGTAVGALLIVSYFETKAFLYLIFGVVVMLYLPWTLLLKAKKQVLSTPAFKNPLHYTMTEEGIYVSQEGNEELQSWDTMHKAISTRNSIILYTTPVSAAIFPRVDLKGLTSDVIEMISINMPPRKVKIRG